MLRKAKQISTAHQRAAQADPIVMHLIVKKTTEMSSKGILICATQAALRAEAELAYLPDFKDDFDKWWDESFRKIALKAKLGQFEELAQRPDCVVVGDVIATVPMKRSQRDAIFNKLQVLTELNNAKEAAPVKANLEYDLLDSMSLGKQVAQIAHAALKLSVEQQIEPSLLANMTAAVKFVSEINTDKNSDKSSYICDAGLTEVKPGTVTAAVVLL